MKKLRAVSMGPLIYAKNFNSLN